MPNINCFKSIDDYRKYYREYRKRNKKKLIRYERIYRRKWRIKNGTFKDKIRSKLREAIRKGLIKKEVCIKCGNKNTHGHHISYLKPLNVIWLCPIHHKNEHKKLSTV